MTAESGVDAKEKQQNCPTGEVLLRDGGSSDRRAVSLPSTTGK